MAPGARSRSLPSALRARPNDNQEACSEPDPHRARHQGACRHAAVQAAAGVRVGRIPAAALVLIDVETDAGLTGRAYVFTFTAGMLKPVVEAVRALAELIEG